MTEHEAEAICDQLEALIGHGPGADSESVRQATMLCRRLREASGATTYLREKAQNFLGTFEAWRSERKWRRMSEDPDQARVWVMTDLRKLRMALDGFRTETE